MQVLQIAILAIVAISSIESSPLLTDMNKKLTKMIVGGHETSSQAFPYQVVFRLMKGEPAVCGGTIISNEWILSAAHCFILQTEIGRKLSTAYIATDDLTTPTVTFHNLEIFIHPDYKLDNVTDPEPQLNPDVSLIRVKGGNLIGQHGSINTQSLKLDTNVKRNLTGLRATVSGFGVTENYSEDPSLRLKETSDLMIEPASVCTEVYNKTWFDYESEANMCIMDPSGKSSSCYGDSGGPLVIVDEKTGEKIQVGIVSRGDANVCARKGLPSIYTRVSPFIPWIQSITKIKF